MRRNLLLFIIASAYSCGMDASTAPDPPAAPGPITFSGSVQPIFTRSCAFATGCHAGPTPQQGMNLSAATAYNHIVNVASMEVPTMVRISPGRPDSSYLVLKIEGRAGLVGGVGTRMPLGGMLTQAQIDTVRSWVADGAPNN